LQALFSSQSTLNIERILDVDLSPLKPFGGSGTTFAQLFYDGVEQFYCKAESCVQTIGNSTTYKCQNLQCTCRPGTTFCGGIPASNLTGAINGLSGTLEIDCAAIDSSTGTATCHFVQATLQSLFGSSGLSLSGCSFGECVRQSVIDTGGGASDSPAETESKSLGGGVIAGLAVVGTLVLLALGFLLLGFLRQRAARKNGDRDLGGSQVAVVWSKLTYVVPSRSGGILRRRKHEEGDKTILDDITGRVRPGQMMAILGPSGMYTPSVISALSYG
jgi:ABC-type multidrug transport system fused ATPase/permease subunit